MMRHEITPRCLEPQIKELAATMRPEDSAEVMASHGVTPLAALRWAIGSSHESYTLTFDGRVAAMFGVVSDVTTIGLNGVWMLTSGEVDRYPKAFMRQCRFVLPMLLYKWGTLYNHIDVRHEKAVRWAERLGFRLDPPAPFGVEGRLFRRFTVTMEDLRWQH